MAFVHNLSIFFKFQIQNDVDTFPIIPEIPFKTFIKPKFSILNNIFFHFYSLVQLIHILYKGNLYNNVKDMRKKNGNNRRITVWGFFRKVRRYSLDYLGIFLQVEEIPETC